ncbi:uncharacterized protein G2W53_041901 [Senna tora]|uniref:Uncharacterized protein n=1 Tax=Senna tora TaxID=362788 RepID=A0A834VZI9_9FABA|nr:uncharacterized protein G2W53_041901 [Senna tora]
MQSIIARRRNVEERKNYWPAVVWPATACWALEFESQEEEWEGVMAKRETKED